MSLTLRMTPKNSENLNRTGQRCAKRQAKPQANTSSSTNGCYLALTPTFKQYLHQQQRTTMASFTFPQHLMHKQLEPQWFPRSKEETESK